MPTPVSIEFPLILFLDDGIVLVEHVDLLMQWEGAFQLLAQKLSLTLNFDKCVIMPLGARTPFQVQRRISEVFPDGHPARRMAIKPLCRWLGFALSRGDFHPHSHMVERMGARSRLMEISRLGTAGNSLLGRSALLSIPLHTLRICSPDEELSVQWERCLSGMLPRRKSFLPSALPRLKELFGFPTNVPLLQQVALEAQLGQISKLFLILEFWLQSFSPLLELDHFWTPLGAGGWVDV
eukprot:6491086-Amphidinium_carterae.1